jgi:HTH-type transcriptional regulator/antitoxin HigA
MGKTLDKKTEYEVRRGYYSLVEQFPLKPIRDDRTHAAAVAVVTLLAETGELNQDQSDYFDVLTNLIADYESQRWAMAPEFSVTQIIESFMEDHGMTQSDLGRTLGDRTLGHKILTGKRQLTVPQIKTLAETFKVSPELFM